MALLDQRIDDVRASALRDIGDAKDGADLELVRVRFLARKGMVAALFEQLTDLPPEGRPAFGKKINELRQAIQSAFENRIGTLGTPSPGEIPRIDLTLPGKEKWSGSKHPLTRTLDEIRRIFQGMGFGIATGPEIEDDYHNFEALNFPPDHPARDMQDTFFASKNVLLRTHTSPVQIRVMESTQPPIRVIIPGKVYRNEAISARSYCLFHQVEGLYVDTGVTFAELKGTLVAFARQFYGSGLQYRFRPSYFPFTEPSAEMDITCFLCRGKGCRVCKKSGWLEILGCGMVDPNVYAFVGYDPSKYSGYAFGMGIERITMLRYGLDDIRIFFENDVRFLKQFP
ncbi:MAG TPA: phenylalanine--tRNA ligase subunit alpha [Bacteroidota bacterium]|nr:phenylalanine--tRNA ligase subunit alpha [Bacteroidota bacterium]